MPQGAAGSGSSRPGQLRRRRNGVPRRVQGRPLRPRRHPRRQPHDGARRGRPGAEAGAEPSRDDLPSHNPPSPSLRTRPWRPLPKTRCSSARRIAARDAKDKATLSELHARVGCRASDPPRREGVEKPAVCLFAPKDVTCVAGMLGALLAGYRFADVPAGSAAPEVRLFGMIQPDVVLAVGAP